MALLLTLAATKVRLPPAAAAAVAMLTRAWCLALAAQDVLDVHYLCLCALMGHVFVLLCQGPLFQTRDAARHVGRANLNPKKSLKNGRQSKVIDFCLNDNYEH